MTERKKDQKQAGSEVKTFSVPFALGEIKKDITIATNDSSKEQIIKQAFKFHSQGNISEAAKYYQYFMDQGFTDPIVFSRYGVIAESKPDVGIIEVLESEAVDKADVVVIDTASSLMPVQSTPDENLAFMQRLRGICSDSHSILLTVDEDEVDSGMLHSLRSSCEVVLDMNAAFVGGELKRNLVVTRFLRASGPVQASVGWRVEPYMGFIVDITAVS